MNFAQDMHSPALAHSIQPWLPKFYKSNAVRWVLLDGSLVDEAKRAALISTANCAELVFPNTRFEAFGEYGPWLLQGPSLARDQGAWIAELLAATNGRPAFSLLETNQSLSVLRQTLVELADQMGFYCRFADTRVLKSLLQVLQPKQLESLATVIHRWHLLDRSGQLVESINIVPRAHAPSDAVLTLEPLQFDQMLEASEADNLFSTLLVSAPDLVPSEHRGVFHAKLERILQAARKRKITDAPNQTQFAILALNCGEEFHKHPVLESTWADIEHGAATLSKLAASWTDDIWAALQHSR